ncbi:30S ribosome-binding factor RbfA [Chitinivibrio alkaliphilus]|uniref:Ribosome-binding factor A n=1 Tax=Chitinivibrio alkaliphilus ACht1 TaxID=1313304 RepID=U7D986_9BACT|nr:30S ribosome-binding factor RbfA [Chitinivibrio alkaliphilus]ERP32146.1 ribosome-binding factor A [Chitinivibrio alkaliphilus ACht1]
MATNKWHNKRVTENLRREILWTITNRVKDPRIPEFLTVPAIELSRDTRNATVYISSVDTGAVKEEAVQILNKAAPFIQREVAKKIRIKHFPRLLFKVDDSSENWENINSILDNIKDDLE